MRYTGESGRTYNTSDAPFFSDDEGRLYEVEGRKGCAVKVLKSPASTQLIDRARQRIDIAPSDAFVNEVSWPIDVIHENGRPVGYVLTCMIEGTPLYKLYGSHASMHFGSKVRVAQNLCVALMHAHAIGWVIGDMNPRNILVDVGTCRVFIAETGVWSSGKGFFGPATSEWLPPDFQGRSLCERDSGGYTEDSDRFALAVHVFALLSRGRHPMDFTLNGSDSISNLALERSSVRVPQPVSAMCDRLPEWSLPDSTYPIRRYQFASFRFPVRLARCINLAFRSGTGFGGLQPSEDEWLRGLADLSRRPHARLSLLMDKDRSERLDDALPPATATEAREGILRVGAEAGVMDPPISDKRMYNRATIGFALLMGLSYCFGSPGYTALSLAASLERLGLTTSFEYVIGVVLAVAGSFLGLACAKAFRRFRRRSRPLTLRDYAAAFVCSAAGSFLLPVACFWLRGAVFR